MTYKKTKFTLSDFNHELGAKPGLMQDKNDRDAVKNLFGGGKKEPKADAHHTTNDTTTHVTTPAAVTTTSVSTTPAAPALANGAITYKDGNDFKEAKVDANGRAHDAKGTELAAKDLFVNVVKSGKATEKSLADNFKETDKLPANLKFNAAEAAELVKNYATKPGLSGEKKTVIGHNADLYNKEDDKKTANITAKDIEGKSAGVEDLEKDAKQGKEDIKKGEQVKSTLEKADGFLKKGAGLFNKHK